MGEEPLSFFQLRQWSLVLSDPHASAYNLPYAFRFTGPLHAGALSRSLNEIVRRHASLRATFTAVGGEPLQAVAPTLAPVLVTADLRGLPRPHQQAEIRRCAREANRCFDLSRGPLLRTWLLRLSADDHVLLLTVHSIVSDEASVKLLRGEMVTLYEAFAAGRPSPLPPLPVQYPDFVRWQRDWLRGEILQSQMDYWRAQLAEAPKALHLPTDRPRPPFVIRRGAFRSVRLPASLVDGVKAQAGQQDVTPFMFFLAAFKTLLHRCTTQSSISVGTLAGNRRWRRTERLIGSFTNPLVLNTRLAGDLDFQEFLARVREATLGAHEHQDVPFDNLVEELEPKRDLSRSPLFQVMLVQQVSPVPVPELPQLKIRELNLAEDSGTELELTLRLREVEGEGGELTAELQFNIALFDPTTAMRLLSQFRSLLAGAVADTAQTLSGLPLLSAAGRQQLLREWSQAAGDDPHERCVHELFEARTEHAPEALAVVDEERRLTYAELNARVNQLAHHLRSRGVGPETLVAICIERSLEMVVGILAILKAGGAYLPLDPESPDQRLVGVLQDAGAPVLLTRERMRERLPEYGRQMICLDADGSFVAREDERNPLPRATPGNAVYVIYTSGSTGGPKGVVVTHRSLVNLVTAAARTYELKPGDRVLQFTSCTFDPSAEEIFTCLVQGATLVLRTEAMMASPDRFLRQCQQWRVSFLGLPTAYWHELATHVLSEGPAPIDSLRLVTIGGERALAERLQEWQAAVGGRVRLVNCYGPTEGTVFATTWEPPVAFAGREVPIGYPISNVQTHLLDSDLQPIPIGVPGQLCIAGTGLARGYLNRPGLTAASFVPSPFSRRPGGRLYLTGDVARYLRTGAIEFLRRVDHQVKVRGFRVEIGEIESASRQLPGVKEAIVLATQPEKSGEVRLVVYLLLDPEQAPAVSELRAALKLRLPDYMIPSAFVPLDALPLTAHGKVDRKALPAPSTVARELEEGFVAPEREVERRLAEIWSQLLEIGQVSVSDNFFDLGGHSLLAPRLLAHVRETFGLELDVRKVFEAPTLAELAAEIEASLDPSHHPAAGRAADFTVDLAAEAVLDPDVVPASGPYEATAQPSVIFLTGATGFIGVFLLHELLHRSTADLLCLVRAGNAGEGWSRLRSHLESYHLWDDAFVSRIVPVIGDLSQPLLGLPEQKFHQLAERVDVIYHCGAQISELQPYSTLKGPNASGTREILRLASLVRAKAVHHVSTLDVFDSPAYDSVGTLYESDSLDHWQSLSGGYSQSKWVAEKYMMAARERGFPVCVYRPGAISGHNHTGASSLEDFTSRHLKGCIQLGMIPDEDGELDLAPVDYLVRAVVHLSRLTEFPDKAFHITNPRPLPMREVVDYVRSCGYLLERVPYSRWRAALQEHVKRHPENALAPFLPLFGPEPDPALPGGASEVRIDWRNTKAGLAGAGIVCPPVEKELLSTYFSYFRRSGFLEDPRRYPREGPPPLVEDESGSKPPLAVVASGSGESPLDTAGISD